LEFDGVPIAQLTPVASQPKLTVNELNEFLRHRPKRGSEDGIDRELDDELRRARLRELKSASGIVEFDLPK
jgi:hypothetical protein